MSKIHQVETGSKLLKEVKSTFERQQKQLTFALITYINNEAQLYERFNVVELVFNLSSIEHVEKDGKILCLWKGSLQDNTDDMSITFLGSLVDHNEEKTAYLLINLRVSKYMFKRPLKTTESIKITVSDKEIQINKENVSDSTQKNKYGNIVKLEPESLNEKLLYSKCKAAVTPEDDFVICSCGNTMSTIENCIKSGNVKFTVLVESSKLQLIAAPGLLVEAFIHPISEKMKHAKYMLKSSITPICCIADTKVVQLTKV